MKIIRTDALTFPPKTENAHCAPQALPHLYQPLESLAHHCQLPPSGGFSVGLHRLHEAQAALLDLRLLLRQGLFRLLQQNFIRVLRGTAAMRYVSTIAGLAGKNPTATIASKDAALHSTSVRSSALLVLLLQTLHKLLVLFHSCCNLLVLSFNLLHCGGLYPLPMHLPDTCYWSMYGVPLFPDFCLLQARRSHVHELFNLLLLVLGTHSQTRDKESPWWRGCIDLRCQSLIHSLLVYS